MTGEEQLRSPGKWTWITAPLSNSETAIPPTLHLFYEILWTLKVIFF